MLGLVVEIVVKTIAVVVLLVVVVPILFKGNGDAHDTNSSREVKISRVTIILKKL